MYSQNNSEKKIITLSAKSYGKVISEGVVLVEYWASWCGPCRKLVPILKEIGETTSVKIAKLNVDNYKAFVRQQKVDIVPTIIIYKDGIEKERLKGFYSKKELLDILEPYL